MPPAAAGRGQDSRDREGHGDELRDGRRTESRCGDILWAVSVVGVVLLAAAVVLLAAAEWPRLARRFGVDGRRRRDRARRKAQLRVVRTESDEFARDVERDLAALPTIDPRDAKNR